MISCNKRSIDKIYILPEDMVESKELVDANNIMLFGGIEILIDSSELEIGGGSTDIFYDDIDVRPNKDVVVINTPYYSKAVYTPVPGDIGPISLDYSIDQKDIQKVEWKEVVTVLYDGDKNCGHDYVNSSPMQKGIRESCLVAHLSPCGCNWDWPHFRRICKKCLRHEDVKKECNSLLLLREMNYNDYLNKLNETH